MMMKGHARVLAAVVLGAFFLAGCGEDPELNTQKQWVRDLRAELKDTRSKLAEARDRGAVLSAQAESLAAERQGLLDEATQTSSALSTLRVRDASATSQLAAIKELLTELGSDAGLNMSDDTDAASAIAALHAANTDAQARLTSSEASVAQLHAQGAALERSRDYLAERVRQLSDVEGEIPGSRLFREREAQLRSELQALANANGYLQRQLSRWQLEHQVAQARVAQARQSSAALQEAKLYLQHQVEELSGTIDAGAKSAADDLAVTLADAMAQRDGLQTELAALQGDVSRLTTVNATLAANYEMSRQSLDVLRGQTTGNLNELKKAQSDAIALRAEFDSEANTRESLKSKVSSLSNARDRAAKELATAEAQIGRLQQMLDTAANQHADMSSTSEEQQKANARLREMLDTAAKQQDEQQNLAATLKGTEERLATAEKTLRETTEQHAATLADYRAGNAKSQAELAGALEEAKSTRDAALQNFDRARAALTESTAALKAAKESEASAQALTEQLAQRLTSTTRDLMQVRAQRDEMEKQAKASSGG
ncbi:MAG: hypothetical protein HOI95_00075 [Chromatiales bacterium]|jgi:chromosome segregation ATPase|nr:hypothetical protein [Chromatiales bacterium]